MTRGWRTLSLSLALVASAGFGGVGHAQDKGLLAARLEDLVRTAELGDGVSVVVAHAATGERLYSLRGEVPRNPASNMKLVTAAAALDELGPDYRLRTTASGDLSADGTLATLVLKGEGDPSLTFADLLGLSRKLVDLGVRRVERIVVDGSAFDGQLLPPAFDQQPGEVASFRAAVAAVSVDRNAYDLRVAPGPAADAPASVILRCPDHFAIESSVTTAASGVPSLRAGQKQSGEQLTLTLAGSVPLGIRGVAYERRVESPLHYAGQCLKAALRTLRVQGAMRVELGAMDGLSPLVVHESEPLSSLLKAVGKNSDNFYAEMLLKVVGAHESGRAGSSSAGVGRAQELLTEAGVARGTVTMVNGSGLFRGNQIAPEPLAKLLVWVFNNPALGPEYLSQLAIAGTDGTLKARLTNLPAPRIVRAKTGTLDDAISLSGYVLGKQHGDALAFSILMNGIAGKQWKARQLADDLVRMLAQYLYDQLNP